MLGMFVPTILSGSVMGAIVGKLVSKVMFEYGSASEARLMTHCALIGAVALLGGILRSSVSLCVIIMEGTGQTELLLPVVCTTIAARVVGSFLNEGLYDTSLHLKGVPFLAEDNPAAEDNRVVAKIMSKDLQTIAMYPADEDVQQILQSSRHHGFPVVDVDGHLRGLIHRRMLALALREGNVATEGSGNRDSNRSSPSWRPHGDQRSLQGLLLEEDGSDADDDADADDDCSLRAGPDAHSARSIDLTAIMQLGPFVCFENCTVGRAYRMFTTLGLRHLPVVNAEGVALGMITRRDFIGSGAD